MEAVKEFTRIKEVAEKIKSDHQQRFPDAASVGDYWRQGDVYITRLANVPSGFKEAKVDLQLAPGDTKGSRHMLSHDRVSMFVNKDADALTGPVIKSGDGVVVEHPEHGNVELPPGTYGITYQRAFAEEIRRVAD